MQSTEQKIERAALAGLAAASMDERERSTDISLAELAALVEKVQSGEIRYCPHGRPVSVKLRKYELEKMFKRA